jgi:RNA polymerase sigma factor (sigma-70 family)
MAAHPEPLLQHLRALVLEPPSGRAADGELLDRFVRGHDEEAFATLVARHGPMVLAACRRALREATAAEDVAQATFLVLARKARSIRAPHALAAWLYRTARNLALKHRRADARRRQRETHSLLAAPDRTVPGPVEEISVRELLAIFDEEVQRLPERFRLPLILCCLEGCTLEEAAHQLGWTPGSVKGRLARGRARLHDRLVRRGLSLSAALVGLEAGRAAASAAATAGFLTATTRAAVLFTARTGGAVAGLAPQVVAMAEEGIRSATLSRVKIVLALLLAVGVLTASVAAVASRMQAPERRDETAVQQPEVRLDRWGDPLPDGALTRLGTLRWRAAGQIEALAVSPDGKTIVTTSSEGAAFRRGLCLIDAASGKRTKTINPAGTMFDRVAFSPDGRRLACSCRVEGSGRSPNRVQILEWPGGKKLHEYAAEDVQWLGWSAGGQLLAVFRTRGAAVLRELATGKEQRFEAKDIRESPFRDALFCACAPGATLLAVADTRGILHVWHVSTGKKRWALQTSGTRVRGLAFSPDARLLAALTAGRNHHVVQLWDVTTGKIRHTLAADQNDLDAVAFTPDGKTLATVGWRDVRFWGPSSAREQGRARGIPSFFSPIVAFSPDSKTLIATERYSRVLHRWDVPSGARKSQPTGHASEPYQVTFSPDGTGVATACCPDGSLIVWDARTGEPRVRVYRGDQGRDCAFSADGRVVLSCWSDDKLVFSDARSGRLLHTLRLADPDRPQINQAGMRLISSADRKTVVAFSVAAPGSPGGQGAGEMLVTGWDTASRKQLFRRRRAEAHFMIAVSGDLEWLAIPQEVRGKREVRIEDLKTGEHRLTLPAVQEWSRPLAFSPDGRLLATTGLRLWELATGREVLALPAEEITSAAFSPDGRLLALSAQSQQVVVYDLRRGKELRRIKGLGANVTCLAFSPDSRRLLSGLTDSTVLVWGDMGRDAGRPARLGAAAAQRAWADLAADAPRAFAARGRLTSGPESALTVLEERVKPVRPAEPRLVRRLLGEMDSDELAVREQAHKALEELGDRATGALRQALAKKPSAEVTRRIRALLRRPSAPVVPSQVLQAVRAVAVLEDIGSPQARRLLEALAGGEPGARLTREAKAALGRLARREASRP